MLVPCGNSYHIFSSYIFLPTLIKHCQGLITASLNYIRIHYKNSNSLCRRSFASILSHSVMTARKLHKAFPRSVHLGRVAIHATQKFACKNIGDNGGTTVPMWRSETFRRVIKMDTDDRFSRGIGQLVVKEDFNVFSRSSSSLAASVKFSVLKFIKALTSLSLKMP